MVRKSIAILGICLFAGFLFAGCSSSGGSGSTTATTCTPITTISGTTCAETVNNGIYSCQGTCGPGLVQTMVGSQMMCLSSSGCSSTCQGNYNGICYQGISTGGSYYNNGYYNTGYYNYGYNYSYGFWPQVIPPTQTGNHHHHHHHWW